jgi:hypothetical protein
MTLTLVLVCALLALLAVGFRAAWRAAGPDEAPRPADRRGRRRRGSAGSSGAAPPRTVPLPPLPAADAPPPGLVPLRPTPQALRTEAVRGIRELEDWLADQAAA